MSPDPLTPAEVRFARVEAPGLTRADHWQASLYDPAAGATGCLPYPVAVAWLTDFRETPVGCVLLDFLLVPDQFRRRGYATALVAACRDRWPELELTDAVSDAGAALLDSLEPADA